VTTALKGVVVAAATAFGALFGIGFLIAALFEVQGFGDRDSTPSTAKLVEYGVGFAACVLIPVFLWRRLLPGSGPAWAIALALAAGGVLLILGLSLKG
jgi:hypothetical protein